MPSIQLPRVSQEPPGHNVPSGTGTQ